MRRKDWRDFRDFLSGGFGPGFAGGPRRQRRWGRWFEPGEMRLVILRLVREKPRHGYEIIKALEERFGGMYSPSAGTFGWACPGNRGRQVRTRSHSVNPGWKATSRSGTGCQPV